MRYVSWVALYEGPSDELYFEVLLPRVIRNLIAQEGTQLVEVPDVPAAKLGARGRSVEKVAAEACEFRDSYDLVFIHADRGGRGVEESIGDRATAYCNAMTACCGWPAERCVTVTPRHETEAWLLADGDAVTASLGYTGDAGDLGLPGNGWASERLNDPKQVLRTAVERVAGRRRTQSIAKLFPAIAQRQRIDLLRRAASFADFEERLRGCLRALGCVR